MPDVRAITGLSDASWGIQVPTIYRDEVHPPTNPKTFQAAQWAVISGGGETSCATPQISFLLAALVQGGALPNFTVAHAQEVMRSLKNRLFNVTKFVKKYATQDAANWAKALEAKPLRERGLTGNTEQSFDQILAAYPLEHQAKVKRLLSILERELILTKADAVLVSPTQWKSLGIPIGFKNRLLSM